jgi:long-chain acyl-CoA synthetase
MANHVWEKSYPPGVKWELDIPKKTIHQIFEESCAQYAGRPFTDFLDKVMTFGDYKDASDRAAAGSRSWASDQASTSGSTCPTRRTTSSPSSASSRRAAGW